MDMYSKYKSLLGYQTGDNGIDSYGVNHGRFSQILTHNHPEG